jgi:hypothetical protein
MSARIPKELTVRVYDKDGNLVEKTTSRAISTPKGIGRLLMSEGIKAVEVHHVDGTSTEFSIK